MAEFVTINIDKAEIIIITEAMKIFSIHCNDPAKLFISVSVLNKIEKAIDRLTTVIKYEGNTN